MFILEQDDFITEEEALTFINEAVSSPKNSFKELIVDPMLSCLEKTSVQTKYISYGDEFLAANAVMLAKEYPTKPVSFPRKYVDNVYELFGFNDATLKRDLKICLKEVNDKTNWLHIMATPTNVLHIVVMYYSDLVQNRKLRDSGRQQLALTVWSKMYSKYWTSVLDESVMAYTYSTLNNTWNIVRSENMITWISEITETGYSFFRAKLSFNMTMKTVVDLLNRIRNDFNQTTRLLRNKYQENLDKGVYIGDDLEGTEDYVDTNAYVGIRNNLMRLIKGGDKAYTTMGDMYRGTARLKNVDVDTLFDFATKKVKYSDIAWTMDLIFYVFLNKEGNSIKDINSTKYINRITNLPTAIDRAIQGKPYIQPMVKKYDEDETIIRAFVCFIAIYIMNRINDVK